MSFLAKLELEGNSYNVLECEYTFNQNYSPTGKPLGLPQGGEISLRIESLGNTIFFDWMIDPAHTKNGKITFFRRDAISKLQQITFKNAFCVFLSEHFNALDQQPLQLNIKISAQWFELNGSAYEKRWKT